MLLSAKRKNDEGTSTDPKNTESPSPPKITKKENASTSSKEKKTSSS